jgi:hypothetical protein
MLPVTKEAVGAPGPVWMDVEKRESEAGNRNRRAVLVFCIPKSLLVLILKLHVLSSIITAPLCTISYIYSAISLHKGSSMVDVHETLWSPPYLYSILQLQVMCYWNYYECWLPFLRRLKLPSTPVSPLTLLLQPSRNKIGDVSFRPRSSKSSKS